MNFTANTKAFKRALEKISKVTATKSQITQLQQVMLSACGGDVHLMATNLVQHAYMRLDASSTQDFDIVLSDTKSLIMAMKSFSGQDTTFELTAGDILAVTCGDKSMTQPTLYPDVFPKCPVLEETEILNNFAYSNKKLKERFSAVKYAASADSTRQIYMGIHFKSHDMVAVDGSRLALNKDESLHIAHEFVVPVEAIKHATNMLGDQIVIRTSKLHIEISDGVTAIRSRLIEGEPINYAQAISQECSFELEANVMELLEAVKYLSGFSTRRVPVVWSGNKLSVDSGNGELSSRVNQAVDLRIGFVGNHMVDALKQFDSETITIKFGGSLTPMLLMSADGVKTALICPVKINNAGSGTAAA
jgi:DNA polymerase III sliding clamp (beta) subunit (PCNA family)